MRRFRYSRWDDTQDPFGADVPAAELLEELSDDILSGAGAEGALSRLMRRGMQGRFSGLDSLRARLRERRRREQGALNLQGPLEEIREQLEEIIERERTTLSVEPGDDARMRETFLDALPPDVPGKVKELTDYRFVDGRAQQDFDALMDRLREEVMGAYFRNVAQGMRSLSGEELARFRDMLAELNDMIERRDRGGPYDFDGFMDRYGDFFPERPRTLDELLEQMARRMAAMSRLLASMSAEQRAELQALAEQVMQDMDLAFEVDRLGSNLSSMFPEMPWGEPALAGGEDAMPLSATVDAMERLHDYEELDRSLRGDYAGASIDDVDEEALRNTLGEDAVRDLRRLKQIERMLEEAGLVSRRDGRLDVTPKGARKLGERALVRVFEELRRDREGAHDARDAGGLAEPTGATRPWRFGDAGQIAVQRIGFNDYARRMEPQDLTAAGWERVYGTNMQHAFNLAGRLLSQHPRSTRQVIMVTDGEPTAHLEGEHAQFHQIVTSVSRGGPVDHRPSRSTSRPPIASAISLSRSFGRHKRRRTSAIASSRRANPVVVSTSWSWRSASNPSKRIPSSASSAVGPDGRSSPWNRSHRSAIHTSGCVGVISMTTRRPACASRGGTKRSRSVPL